MAQNFTPDYKTVDYITVLLSIKGANSDIVEKMRIIKEKISVGNSAIVKLAGFDRNAIIKIQIMKNLILYFRDQRENNEPFSNESIRVFNELINELIQLIQYIESENVTKTFLIKPSELLKSFLTIDSSVSKKLYNIYIELAIEYIEQLENKSYSLINYIDNIDFDIKSYYGEFFELFFSIESLPSRT